MRAGYYSCKPTTQTAVKMHLRKGILHKILNKAQDVNLKSAEVVIQKSKMMLC